MYYSVQCIRAGGGSCPIVRGIPCDCSGSLHENWQDAGSVFLFCFPPRVHDWHGGGLRVRPMCWVGETLRCVHGLVCSHVWEVSLPLNNKCSRTLLLLPAVVWTRLCLERLGLVQNHQPGRVLGVNVCSMEVMCLVGHLSALWLGSFYVGF